MKDTEHLFIPFRGGIILGIPLSQKLGKALASDEYRAAADLIDDFATTYGSKQADATEGGTTEEN